MQRADIIEISQILVTIKELISGLERAEKNKDIEKIMQIKKEIITLNHEVSKKIR